MYVFQQLPLQSGPQTYDIVLSGIDYQLTFTYHDALDMGWTLDVSFADGSPIIAGIPLVCGSDLLAQYQHLNLGGALIVLNANQMAPTYADMGTSLVLLYVTLL